MLRDSVFVFLWAALSVTTLPAAPRVKNMVVKVSSGLCRSSQGALEGSGFLFKHEDKAYVLTSEHVVLHANDQICHAVEIGGAARKALLLRADWGMGLALLRLDGLAATGLADLDRLQSHLPSIHDGVETLGFPFGEKEPAGSPKGIVLMAASARHLVPSVPRLIEIIHSHGEFGMSGSPVVGLGGDRIVGILSHQYLAQVPGSPTEVREFRRTEKREIESHLLVIPSPVAARWVSQVLSGEHTNAYARDPLSQLRNKDEVYSGGLRFEAVGQVNSPEIGGGEGVGVGGGEGVGVGGGEGVGVGGNGVGAKSKRISVRITTDRDQRSPSWEHDEAWLASVKRVLCTSPSVTIDGFFARDAEGNAQPPRGFGSVAEFFSLLQKPGMFPLEERREANARSREKGKAARESCDRLLEKVDASEARLLLKQMRTVARLAEIGELRLLRASDIDALVDLEREGTAWGQLATGPYSHEFTEAMSLVRELRDELHR